MSRIERFRDPKTAAEACGAHILRVLREAVAARGRARVAVSGGSTPAPMFELFRNSGLDWTSVQVFWVDERCVPQDDEQSNFRMARELWLGPAGVPEKNVHRVRTELTPQAAAEHYGFELRREFELEDVALNAGELPHFDAIHLGMGADGHTASLFPGDPLIEDGIAGETGRARQSMTAAVRVDHLDQWRVTLLPELLQSARNIAILATGADKAETLERVLRPPYEPMLYPVQLVSSNVGPLTWFVDDAAMARVDTEEGAVGEPAP